MWYEYIFDRMDIVSAILSIIDDALCYGFEFKVENHKLYFREIQ